MGGYRIPNVKTFVSRQRYESYLRSLGTSLQEEQKQEATERKERKQETPEQRKQKNLIRRLRYAERHREVKEQKIQDKIREIQAFQHGSDEKLEMKFDSNLIADDYKRILSTLRQTIDKVTVLKTNERYFTLNDRNLKVFFDVEEEQPDSVNYLVGSVIQNNYFEVMQRPRASNERPQGAFFKYLNKTNINLERQQIYKSINSENYQSNCLVYALLLSGIKQNKLTFITGRIIPKIQLANIAKTLNICICLYDNNRNIYYGDKTDQMINLGLIEQHYFLNEDINITEFAVKHYEEIKDLKDYNVFYEKKSKTAYRKKDVKISTYRCISLMLEHGLFSPIDISTEGILTTQYYDQVEQEIKELSTDQYLLCEYKESNKTDESLIYYADFETYTNGEKHEEFMVAVSDNKNNIKTFIGSECALSLLNLLPDKAQCYFHNLGYDFSFIIKKVVPLSIIKTGSKVKMFKCIYRNKTITFRDSYALISHPLKNFSSIFKLESKKEILPYALYTKENVNKLTVHINDALFHIKEEDKQEFLSIAKPHIINDRFYLLDYCKFYCIQDVVGLREGMKCFNRWMTEAFGLNAVDFISIPSLANNYLTKEGVFNDCFKISGNTRNFIQRGIVGGRCILPQGKKHLKAVVNDFDAVGLYSSAMTRMGFLKGEPKILSAEQLNLQFLNDENKCDGYFIEITNIKVSKRLFAPLQSIINKSKTRIFTNDFPSDYKLVVDKIALEDFIKFQGATFDIVKGYYFNEGRNYEISKVIKHMFLQRKLKKKDKNPIQEVYKLIMNAAYGKTIQKAINTKIKFTSDKKAHDKFLDYNYNFIDEFNEIAPNKYSYKVKNAIEKHFNLAHIGCEILSMSKRIMNEVMCLAEDLNIEIYYQDTDSMHLLNKDIPHLCAEFKKHYDRELLGEELGQFHSDFSLGKGINDVIAEESIFIGKKCYIDKLSGVDSNGVKKNGFHIRLKGIPESSIDDIIETKYNGDSLALYKDLLNGKKIKFNLLAGKVRFQQNKDFSYSSKNEFFREVSF